MNFTNLIKAEILDEVDQEQRRQEELWDKACWARRTRYLVRRSGWNSWRSRALELGCHTRNEFEQRLDAISEEADAGVAQIDDKIQELLRQFHSLD